MAPGTLGSRLTFVPVAVASAPSADFCIDTSVDDPVAAWFAGHDWIDEPVQRAFLEFVRPGTRVLDLGSHLGTFSLAASALGAEVLAVDAAPAHVELLSEAARRNGFDSLTVMQAAITGETSTGSDTADTVPFIVRSIHGHVHTPGEPADEVIDVPTSSVDQLLELVGWDDIDLIKMDIEGSEVAALRGMQRLFDRGSRPTMVLESNVAMLELFGSSVAEMRSLLAELGYDLLLIDHLRPGYLVETQAASVQTECASDVIALTNRPPGLAARWTIETGLSKNATVARVLNAAASPAAGYRRAAADLLQNGPPWLREAPSVGPAIVALSHDVAGEVRDAGVKWHGSAFDHFDAPKPDAAGLPDGVAIEVESVSIGPPGALETPLGTYVAEHKVVLRNLSFHVNVGEPVAVLARGKETASGELLLSALAGQLAPVAGSLLTAGTVVRLSPSTHGLEPTVSIAENAVVLGVSLGAHIATVQGHLDAVLLGAGLSADADAALHAVGADAAVRLCLAVALECTQPAVLLIGAFPGVTDTAFRAWAADRVNRLVGDGTAIVQLVADRAELLVEPVRALWLADGALCAAGHGPSVLEAAGLQAMGFTSRPGEWTEDLIK